MAQAAGAAAVETTSSKVKNPTETKQNFSDSSSFDSYTSKVKIQMKKLSEQFQDFERNEKDKANATDFTKYLDSDSDESI